MSLPSDYTNAEKYFASAIDFLQEYKWIYKHSNTSFIKSGVLESLPNEFKSYFSTITNEELNKFPLLNCEQDSHDAKSLMYNFRSRLKSLIPVQAYVEVPSRNSSKNEELKLRKMNVKKQHEIIKISNLIHQLCKNDVELLIDFGAGLGYLSEILSKNTNNKYMILGLEAELDRVETARKRQQEFMPEANNKIIYEQQFISESSDFFIKTATLELAQKNQKHEINSAIIGLHACADLSITAIKLFFKIVTDLKRLIIMPCCYHKLEMNVKTKTFLHFPLSQTFKNIILNYKNYTDFLNRPFLRLACQQTLARWQNSTVEEHEKHGIDMFRRGMAEAIVNEEIEYVIKKRKTKTDLSTKFDFKETFMDFCTFYELRSKSTHKILQWKTSHELRFNELQEKYSGEGYKLTEGLTCLQTAMQKLCENIVLYDRLCYMQEYASANNLKVNVRYEKLLDEKLSPRCYVLIAEKL